jgi:hypothetical protein
VQPFVVGQELDFRQEATKRLLQELHENDDIDGLMNVALLLNSLWHQQTAIARWFAKEAAENLGEAWEASRNR